MAEKEHPHRSILIFSAPVVKKLVTNEVRLPPNYIGVRRIRPSSFHVQNEFRGRSLQEAPKKNEIVYKITDANGVERRMNSKEKKAMKLKLKEERAAERKRQKEEQAKEEQETEERAETEKKQKSQFEAPILCLPEQQEGYLQLEVSRSALEEELADLRGDRDGVPPVMLSPALANQALRSGGILSTTKAASDDNVAISTDGGQPFRVTIDDELASRWATAIKSNMKSAEQVREQEEGIRPMPYQLTPEVWARLRPVSLSAGSIDYVGCVDNIEKCQESDTGSSSTVWSALTVRRSRGTFDSDTNLIVSAIHRNSDLHISCGAKFGCDFLLYDGRRDQRHAFAGLRIVERSASELPLPSPYDLTGYVRCLNTAGKLALLATIERDVSSCVRLAFVDLALEKILERGKRKRSRREAGMNLEKAR